MRRKIFLCIFIFILALFVFNRDAYSDFGSFSGNSDYDSSSSSSSSSSSRSYGSGGSTRRSVSLGDTNNFNVLPLTAGTLGGSTSDDIEGVILVFVLVIIFFLLIKMKKGKRSAPIMINTDAPAQNLRPMNEYLELDPNFDEEKIKTLMSNLYVQMQDTWRDKDISSLRPYMTDAFYNQMERQLEAFRKNHRTDYTERIAVLNVGLKGWRQSTGRDYITVRLNSRIVSYVLDDFTGKLISGDREREKFLEYEIELTRKSGEFTTPETEGVKSDVCPHCGAPIKLNASAKCEYCGSIITAVNTDWAICSMKGISQRTA
ncbi:MAG: TIM44-like domain-containing protein [Synergistales bacterium]|nr:TIM44-like domain-containing protein [Synergistales bacterium]MDY6434397.1 TIM44-like domain-containing protein [Synergistales bacterium]